jgi:hypothetical protein
MTSEPISNNATVYNNLKKKDDANDFNLNLNSIDGKSLGN